jgi:hypothetical protein
MTKVRRDSARQCDQSQRRLSVGHRAAAFRLALLLATCSVALFLWVPGFHHHAAGNEGGDCTVCLTVGAQSSDLPIIAAALAVPPPTEGRSLFEQALPPVTDAANHSESPRGPPLT